MNSFRIYFCLFFCLFFYNLFAAKPIVLKEREETYYVAADYVDIYFDSLNAHSIEEVSSAGFSSNFRENKEIVPRISANSNGAYWVRFYVQNDVGDKVTWLLELYDFEIDKFEIFIPDTNGTFYVRKGGDKYPFSNKEFYHKNFVYELPQPEASFRPYYIKFQSESPVGLLGAIRSIQTFSGYATTEYFCLAIFYGIALAMIIYNLFLFITVRDRAYLFFVLYILSLAAYVLCHDGTGFKYLWPNQPWLNRYVQPTAGMLALTWGLLYSKSFLTLKQNAPLINRFLTAVIALRIILYLITLFILPENILILYFDITGFFMAYVAGFICFKRGFTPARYYVLAFSFLFAGFITTSLETLGHVPTGIFTVYSLNFGLVAEMLLLSFALGDRIKLLMKEKDKAQRDIIFQLKEKEALKDKLNKELEQKVKERTIELEHKNQELDTFVYKASHDIKGPLKSVIGLTTVGMTDVKDSAAHTYFEHILKSTRRLDSLLSDLLELTQVKQAVIEPDKINFREIVDEVLGSFEHFPRFHDIKFKIDIEQEGVFWSDRTLVYSIIQNLIENPIKYCRADDLIPFLKIRIMANENHVSMTFADNGIGISREVQAKVFEMFFKENCESPGTGLGLHIVKLSVDKLGGTVKMRSNRGQGSVFMVSLNALNDIRKDVSTETVLE